MPAVSGDETAHYLTANLNHLLKQKLGKENYELMFLELESPDCINYPDEIGEIINRKLRLPVVFKDGKVLCSGVQDFEEVYTMMERR